MTAPTPPEKLYTAKSFKALTALGVFEASGTLCGHIDFVGPSTKTLILSPDEIGSLIIMLTKARDDVLSNSDPVNDPRLYDRSKP